MANDKNIFIVDGKPFFPFGTELLLQSGYSVRDESEIDAAFKALQLTHGNTGEFPVYWDEVEPEEGKFNFSSVDTLISFARRYGVKLCLLWFGTWKNGTMDYAPAWIKTNPQRFQREKAPSGKDVWVLSAHCTATLEADKQAFSALCRHLKAKDKTEHTVIGIQVENEPNITEIDRDHGTEAQTVFDSPVPALLVSGMKTAGRGDVYDRWQKSGGKESGTWTGLFGAEAGHFMHTWAMATYIDAVAKAGKDVYDLPMYINIAGPARDYDVLDIWKWFTPHIKIIGPDIYIRDSKEFDFVCAKYTRGDNPLFAPESWGSINMLHAIADYNTVGYFTQNIRRASIYGDVLSIPETILKINMMQCVSAVMPLILKYRGTGKIQAIMQPEKEEVQKLDFDGFTGIVEFGDWRPAYVPRNPPDNSPGGGMVIQASRNEFYIAGNNCRLHINAKPPFDRVEPTKVTARWPYGNGVGYTISIEEGHFDADGVFVADRRRNGDETYHGAWVEPNIGVVRIIMCDS